MPLDPKYAELPWIAHDQPDVYEAGDLPEVDQKQYGDDIGDGMLPKEIENVKLSVDDAHKRFAPYNVYSANVDFSDSIAGSGYVGYMVDSGDYEILPPNARDNESVPSRLQRLQTEVAQLTRDVVALSEQSKSADETSITPALLLKATEALGDQLKQMRLEEVSEMNGSVTDETTITLSNVIKQLDSLEFTHPSERKPDASTHVVYEIYDRFRSSDSADMEKVSELDRRIQHLEALIGQPDPTRLSALTADIAQHSLLDAASRLCARSALLQPSHLDMIETRLSGLQTRLQAITEKRDIIVDADTQNKVAELYELVKKWDDVAESLPMIVERLSELKELHEEASEFSTALSNIETCQKSVDNQLGVYSKLLHEVQANWTELLQTVKENLKNLETRLG